MNRGDFGDGSRWLIHRHWDRSCWLLHEPVRPGALPAQSFPSFGLAVAGFVAFSAFDELKERQP
jgi:hypothetical protein